ncbi:MAG: hypothetical protein J7K94_02335 [Dehalococcoidia bacterium]|nr:hypothetical protein [Dehalococcoidia bacterium]
MRTEKGFHDIKIVLLIIVLLVLSSSLCGCGPDHSGEIVLIQASVAGDAEIFYGRQPPYSSASSGSKVHLVNEKNAVNPTWEELMQFISDDNTDKCQYIPDLYVCGDFAETLHDNAERAGIRCAWVAVHFAGEDEEAHALNVFNTVDRGIVFVDCVGEREGSLVLPRACLDPETGESIQSDTGFVCDADKIAYVREGKEYGSIILGEAESPLYEFYEAYALKWEDYEEAIAAYNAMVGAYNQDVAQYNEEVGGRTVIYDQQEYNKLKAKYNMLKRERLRLENEVAGLQSQRESLGGCCWSPLGVVSQVEVYW